MTNTELIKEILLDPSIKEKYKITQNDIDNIEGDYKYQKDVVKIIRQIVNNYSNHTSATISYNIIKNVLNL